MANGFKGSTGYTFAQGRAMRVEDPHGSPAQEVGAPGWENAGSWQQGAVPGQVQAVRDRVRDMAGEDAFALREGAASGRAPLMGAVPLMADDRAKMRRLYAVFGGILLVCFSVSCCADLTSLSFRSPAEVVQGLATWASIAFAGMFSPQSVADMRVDALASIPSYLDCAFQLGNTVKYAICGIMLAVSGMLYQNAFRNPIAAPSMLGVTNGISLAVLVLVLQFGWYAYEHIGLYYLYSFIGGALVLALVMLGGKWTSGRRKFNVVNMILIGTIVSQLAGVLIIYIENNFLTEMDWEAYNNLVQAADITSVWMFVSLAVGSIIALVPVLLFRFRLNLVSFSDEETKFLGVDPTKLRLLALGCGSVMILVAQVNAGQVAMMSLVIPFIVRAVFGSEFRKQLGGNVLVGATLLIVCGLLSDFIIVNDMQIGLGAVTTLIALPLFVWMLAIRQRSWD